MCFMTRNLEGSACTCNPSVEPSAHTRTHNRSYAQRSNCRPCMMPPLLNPARERATDAPLSDSAEGDGGHARARKWPVSEYGRKCRRLPLRQVPGLLCPRGARAKSVHRHLPSMSSLYFIILNAFCPPWPNLRSEKGSPAWAARRHQR